MTYAGYLWHVAVMGGIYLALRSEQNPMSVTIQLSLWIVCFGLTLVASYIIYYFIEVPIATMLQRLQK
jgi:peptidoglycan/LPS O-acetylase OafA/YrhL